MSSEKAKEKMFEALFGGSEEREIESTRRLKKNMKEELNTLERKAYKEGFETGRKSAEPSEEDLGMIRGEGVLAIWDKLNELVDEKYYDGMKEDGTKMYVINAEEFSGWMVDLLSGCPFDLLGTDGCQGDCEYCNIEAGEESVRVGDIVLDKSGNRCEVTNTDTHIHVIYPNGKTKKWDKTDKFTKTGERSAERTLKVGHISIAEEDF